MAPTDRTLEDSRALDAAIVLAHEASVRLGPLVIEPAMRRVVRDDGGEEFLEPRVMQTLVALLRAGGRILSRDDLLAQCWGGVEVGEDALNRVIGRLRRLAEGVGEGAFRIETITKVGYRLLAEAQPAPAEVQAEAPDRAPEPLLAVLAFDNLSGDADFLYFSDGVSEEILHTVAKRTGLRVVGRSSSFQLRGPDKSARRVAAELNATHLLDGSVRRSGDQIRITAQLVDCATQTELWSDRFDRALTDIFALQDEIAAAIATALNATLSPAPAAGPIDPVAYDLYLRGRMPLPTFMAFDLPMLEQAVARAPEFAQAWAMLAFARAVDLCWDNRAASTPQDWDGMRQSARRALELDPTAGVAYLALAIGLPICGRYAEQFALVDKALAVSPHDPIVLTHASGLENTVGRHSAALAYATQAFELDPYYTAPFYAAVLEAVGRREDGWAAYDRALARWPHSILLVAAALRSACESEAWERYDRLRAAVLPEVAEHWLIGALDQTAKTVRNWSPATAEIVIARLRRELAKSGVIVMGWAGVACEKGLTDTVYELIEASSFDHFFTDSGGFKGVDLSFNVIFSPIFAAMRRDIRFVRFCDRLGYCDFWVRTGLWPDFAAEVAPVYDLRAEARRLVAARGGAAAG
jgi:TolB-like protein